MVFGRLRLVGIGIEVIKEALLFHSDVVGFVGTIGCGRVV
jgi:hypothetical protein